METYAEYAEKVVGQHGVSLLNLQKEELMPLIMEEKTAFMKAEYGRLQQIMGAEYSVGDEPRVFHPLPESKRRGDEQVYGDPEELTLEELAMLPHLTHNIPRLGTMTVMPLIRYYPEDISRLRLLADMYQELMVGRACPDVEVRALLTGHSEYLLFKKGKEVRIIT